jgi:excinuclease ABC subunit B
LTIDYEKNSFELHTPHKPSGDQPTAIKQLVTGINDGLAFQTLLGATGTGKTYTMAQVIAKTNRPALVIAPNKTLCAQLYSEMKAFFPNAAVEYFVSYFDYYQPETYLPAQDKYIDKDSMVNEYLQTLRLAATKSIMTRQDTIIVATVSAIYGLGETYEIMNHSINLKVTRKIEVKDIVKQLVKAQYEVVAPEKIMAHGQFKKLGDTLVIQPAEAEDFAIRVEFFDDMIEDIKKIDPITGAVKERLHSFTLFPATHYVVGAERLNPALDAIRAEMETQCEKFMSEGKYVQAQRLKERTLFDLEMLENIGYCRGIENYSRHFTGRSIGQPPPTLLDYLPKESLIFIDESHTTVPQLSAMYAGDRSRKEVLVENGFRLPSAYDARPLSFKEVEEKLTQVVFVSATPSEYELTKSAGEVAEQVIRPTGIVDPEVEVRPVRYQVDDLMSEITDRAKKNERVLVTVLSKQMAEQLAQFYNDNGLKARYLHGDVEAVERVEILRDLRLGKFDVLVGINLLREGLDLPEVSLVAIMDADKEGFLRNARSLIQTIGRAARNASGHAIFYADKITDSMQAAINETDRRRTKQLAYNAKHKITPKNAANAIRALLDQEPEEKPFDETLYTKTVKQLERLMKDAAKNLEYEKAAKYRDRINELNRQSVGHI